MKRKSMLFAIIIGVALISALAIQAQRPQQMPGGGPGGDRPGGGRMGGMMVSQAAPLESSWAQLCFEIGIDDAAMTKAKKLYKEAWDKRKAVVQKGESSSGDQQAMQSLRGDAEKINTNLMTKLKDVLSAEQMKKLNDWAAQAQTQRRPQQRN